MARSPIARAGRRPLLAVVLAAVLVIPGGVVSASGPGMGAAAPTATLRWSACADPELAGFECATLTVPLAWDDPARGTLDLAVARHRSTGPAGKRIGSLLFNPGGPGLSGVSRLPLIWELLPGRAACVPHDG